MNKKIITVSILIISVLILSGCINDKEIFNHNGNKRLYQIYIPSTYDGSEKMPLVLAFHGGGGNSDNMKDKTGFNEIAEREEFIVVYPDGSGKLRDRLLSWNAGYCCGYALENNVDDVDFIRSLITELQNKYSIDQSMIFATGHSNGAMMSYRLGSELSDIIAGIAPVAGSIGGRATEDSEEWIIPDPEKPVSVLAIHGLLDENVPYDGGTGENTRNTRVDKSVSESIHFWVEHNNCDTEPISNTQGNITIDIYSNGNKGTEVVLITILNGGHYWPGTEQDPYQDIIAAEEIWDFFKDHPKQI